MVLDFEKNLGDIDRVVRVFIGSALIWLATAQYISGGWATLAVIIGASQFIESAYAY